MTCIIMSKRYRQPVPDEGSSSRQASIFPRDTGAADSLKARKPLPTLHLPPRNPAQSATLADPVQRSLLDGEHAS